MNGIWLASAAVLTVLGVLATTVTNAHAQTTGSHASCATGDTAAAATAVRTRLTEWVRQANANDVNGMNEVWAPGLVGWFPRASVFSDSAAFAVAGFPATEGPRSAQSKYELVIDNIVASGSVVVVHDVWTQTKDFGSRRVRRVIRGSELWRCQPDGNWRIARWVSAPEEWKIAQ